MTSLLNIKIKDSVAIIIEYDKENTFKIRREILNKNALSDDFKIKFSLPFLIGRLIKGHRTEVNKGEMGVVCFKRVIKINIFFFKKKKQI